MKVSWFLSQNFEPFAMENRNAITITVAIFMALLCFPKEHQALGQVTFSRDWNPGKRSSISGNECSIRPGSIPLCQMIMNEIRILAACEAQAIMNHIHDDSNDPSRK